MKKYNILYSLAIIAIGAFAGIYALRYASTDKNLSIGADFFPVLMSLGLVATGIVILIGSLRGAAVSGEGETVSFGVTRLASFAVACILYFLLLAPLGFIPASALMVAFCMIRLGCRQWLAVALYAIIMPSAIFVLFYYFMYVDLPLGVLEHVLPKY